MVRFIYIRDQILVHSHFDLVSSVLVQFATRTVAQMAPQTDYIWGGIWATVLVANWTRTELTIDQNVNELEFELSRM